MLERIEAVEIDEPPKGYMSPVQLHDTWDVHIQTVNKTTDTVQSELGNVMRVKRSNNPADVFLQTNKLVALYQ